jgi:hypothetical protein
VRLEARPRIHRGDHVVIYLAATVDRGAQYSVLDVSQAITPCDWRTLRCRGRDRSGGFQLNFFGSSSGIERFDTQGSTDHLADGTHLLRVEVRVSVDASHKRSEAVAIHRPARRRRSAIVHLPSRSSS